MTKEHVKNIDNLNAQVRTLTGGVDFINEQYDEHNTNVSGNLIIVEPGTVFPLFFVQNDGNSHTYRFEDEGGGQPPYDLTYTMTENARTALTSADGNLQFYATRQQIQCGGNGVPVENVYGVVTKTGEKSLNLYIATAAAELN